MYEFGFALERAVRRGLAIQNRDPALFDRLRGVEAKWRSPLHLSRAAEADAGSKQVAAAPWLAETEVGMELLGLSKQQIARALAEKRRMQGASVLAERLAQSAAESRMNPAVDDLASRGEVDPDQVKKAADAMGVLIRSGVDPVDAAARTGMAGLKFTGAVPVNLRMPETDANKLEEK